MNIEFSNNFASYKNEINSMLDEITEKLKMIDRKDLLKKEQFVSVMECIINASAEIKATVIYLK
jgi:deoxyribose-phosphate aldolase